VNSLERLAATTFEMNEIGVANLWTDRPLVFTPFEENKELGGFILIDKISNATVAAGLIHFALRRSQNVHSQKLQVTPAARAAIKGQQPKLLWFTGLSGAGKSTIADLVEQKLHALGHHTFLLDGDNLRLGLTKDLGFTDADRIENIRRVAEAAKLMTDAGLIVLAALISPFRADREMVRSMFPKATSSRSSSIRRSPRRSAATPRGSTRRRERGCSSISPASTPPTSRRKIRKSGSRRWIRAPRPPRRRSCITCWSVPGARPRLDLSAASP
jgi:bifunctional enzyme CysN/CysC